MGWIIIFVLSWILFILCADWKKLWPGILGGIYAVIVQIIVDRISISLNLYTAKGYIIDLLGSGSIFFTLGPVFTMGTLLVQNIPDNRWMRLLNIFVWVGFFMLMEWLMLSFGYLEYRHWNQLYSLWVDIVVLMNISWVGENFVKMER
ncbi:hypothetical protein [Caldanaerobius polysaccharolyticus]|uniref:hypothetical protein n=1 Tax=Caldanaerobius polysaccharolyticus TaxID=44256 RepID=UPI00047DDD11|nr:hypothetical protein [Caldanaerobius polysaccharolyticus]